MMGLSLFIDSIADYPVVLINTLLQGTWMLLLVVKNNPSVFVSKAVYRQPTALVQHGVRKCHIDTITYGQCALLDETVFLPRSHTINNLNQEVNPTWHAMPLQARFFLHLMRATGYWTTLKTIQYESARATLLHSRLLRIPLSVVVTLGLNAGLQLSLHPLRQSAQPDSVSELTLASIKKHPG